MFTHIRNRTRSIIQPLRYFYLTKILRINIHPSSIVSFGAFLDQNKTIFNNYWRGTIITRGAMILSHDYTRGLSKATIIGDNCFIGVNAIVMPGVRIGNNVVIGAQSVVTHNIESNCLAVGNPARVVRKINTGPYGRIVD